MIEIKGISKTYKAKKSVDTRALININLNINDKGLVFIVGKSGSGKSTLLNLLGGLDSPDKGKIIVDGKDICTFKNKDLDAYRNSYVGFIFQDFNTLEEFNVFDNIKIALKLQNIDDDKRVEDVLKKVDLAGLGNRNINELSGGQKQRVSIARALVKNPKLILADEPTGNLDRKSSDKIFDILKSISKDSLVVVVSHDIEAADTYADRIIRIEDGKIIKDSKELKEIKADNSLELKKSKLPFFYAFKMAMSYTLNNPFRLIMAILLTMIGLSFMGFAVNMFLFDNTGFAIDTMKENNITRLKIESNLYIQEDESRVDILQKLNNDKLSYIEEVTSSTLNNEYTLYEDGVLLSFDFGNLKEELLENKAYNKKPFGFKYIVLKDKRIINDIIGSYPSKDNEIVVHKYFADSIMNYGIKTTNNEYYRANSYEDIINSKTKIKLNNHEVVISGIVNDDNSIFDRSFKTGDFWSNEFERYYNEFYVSLSSLIYVTDGFIDNINLTNKVNTLTMNLEYEGIPVSNIEVLNHDLEYIDLNGNEITTEEINSNEVILSFNSLKSFNEDFRNNLDSYLDSNNDKTYNLILKDYLKQYIKNNNITSISLKDKSNNRLNESILKVVGFTLGDTNYISDKYEKEYSDNQKSIYATYIYSNNIKDLKNIYNTFTIRYDTSYFLPGEMYLVSFNGSESVSSIIYAYHYIKRYLLNFSLVFMIFAFLLVLNFISNSISNARKQIGILRSIGSTKNDILKIFEVESLIIGIISWIFGVIMWIIESTIINNSIFNQNYYFMINGIFMKPIVVLILFVFIVIISALITISLIDKINRVKPIDVILNRK